MADLDPQRLDHAKALLEGLQGEADELEAILDNSPGLKPALALLLGMTGYTPEDDPELGHVVMTAATLGMYLMRSIMRAEALTEA